MELDDKKRIQKRGWFSSAFRTVTSPVRAVVRHVDTAVSHVGTAIRHVVRRTCSSYFRSRYGYRVCVG